ncbi:uncharacterized protein LOC129177813 [Dunckerocampus dactyliophorus]|uniref:uncharacterized protein LOC129177813 n=1 Tax=Dunckerocampus dactyliophorus TaxID=161453 RepID=UPI002404A59E|nr:uncharacterized protein LOC129177813 [Dunckerocampus dactyliophorus]
MASIAGAVPLPELCADNCALVDEEQFQALVRRGRSLTDKILLSIPDAHTSCIHIESLQLNSDKNAKLGTVASIINIPAAPVLRTASEKLENSLGRMHEGLQLHRALLSTVSPRLQNTQTVTDLMDDVRDLAIQVSMMLKMLQTEYVMQTPPPSVTLHLPAEYEVQVAAHLTLVRLQSLSQDMAHFFSSLDHSNDETYLQPDTF